MPVEIQGLAETLTALRKFEPDLAKNLNKEVRLALVPIQKKAQGYFKTELPGLSNWMLKTEKKKITKETSAFATGGHFPRYNKSIAARGIHIFLGQTRKNSRGFVTQYRISNITAAGAIYETAGRINSSGRGTTHVTRNRRTGERKTVHTTHDSGSNNPDAGLHFINSIGGQLKGNGRYRGRVIYRAWDEDNGKALGKILKAIDMTVTEFSRKSTTRKITE
jgi:hypothetical protein